MRKFFNIASIITPQVAVIHNHLNLVYLESKDYEAAEAHIKLAIENGKLQDDKSQLAVYLVNYGFLHLKKGIEAFKMIMSVPIKIRLVHLHILNSFM